MQTPHRLPIRVYYEDTDFSGVVYHASYLRFMERGRTELLRDLGIGQNALYAGPTPLGFVVRAMSVDFHRPARMDDLVRVETSVLEVKGASVTMAQKILRDDALLIAATVRVAAAAGGKAVRLPPEIREKLQGF